MTVIRFLASIFFSIHVIAVMCCLFPSQTVFQDSLVKPFTPYLKLIHAVQGWPMFTAIPKSQPIDFEIYAETKKGEWLNLHPMLPGLREIDHSLRTMVYLFFVVEVPHEYLDAYANRVCDALTIEKRLNVHRIYLHLFISETRDLDKIRQDGYPSRNRLLALGPWYCQAKFVSPPTKPQ